MFAISGSAPVITFTLQESDDLQNWTTKASLDNSPTECGYFLQGQTTNISTVYVRLKVVLTGTMAPKAVLSAGINTAAL